MAILRSVGFSVVASFVFAFALWYAGVGGNFGVLFALFLCLIFPGLFYVQATTVPEVKEGEPKRKAWLSPGLALLIIIPFYLLVAYAWYPVVTAMIYAQAPETFSATIKLMRRNDILAGIELDPTDSAILVFLRDAQTAESRKIALQTRDKLVEIYGRQPNINEREKYAQWLQEKNDFMLYVLQLARTARVPTSAAEPVEESDGAFSTNDIFPGGIRNSFRVMPWWGKMIVGALILIIIMHLIIMLVETKDKRKGRLIQAITIATLALIAIAVAGHYYNSDHPRPRLRETTSIPPAVATTPVVVATRQPIVIDADRFDLSVNSGWVSTGRRLRPGEKLVLQIVSSNIYNPNHSPCGPRGCTQKQIEGPLFCEEFPHMGILVRIGNSVPYFVDDTVTLDADALGESGEIWVIVNQVTKKPVTGFDADSEWRDMEGKLELDIYSVR